MKLEKLFDIGREPPTAEKIDAAIQLLSKRQRKLLAILVALPFVSCVTLVGVLFFVNAFPFVSLTRQGLPFMVLVISFLIFMVMLIFSAHLKVVLLGLSKASNASLNKLLVLIKPEARPGKERTYIEGVLREGRPFSRFEAGVLLERMMLRDEDQKWVDTMADLKTAVQAPHARQ